MIKFFTLLAACSYGLLRPMATLNEELQEPEIAETETEDIVIDGEVRQWLEGLQLGNLVNWITNSGALVAVIGILTKYKKYKSTTLDDLMKEFKKQIKDHLDDNFKEMANEKIQALVDELKQVQLANETIMKVLVLMQDNTAKGRAALIEYLGTKTTNEEVKEAAEQVKQELAVQEEQKEQVKKEFEEIF